MRSWVISWTGSFPRGAEGGRMWSGGLYGEAISGRGNQTPLRHNVNPTNQGADLVWRRPITRPYGAIMAPHATP